MVATKYAFFPDDIIDKLHNQTWPNQELELLELNTWRALPVNLCDQQALAAARHLDIHETPFLLVDDDEYKLKQFMNDPQYEPQVDPASGLFQISAFDVLKQLNKAQAANDGCAHGFRIATVLGIFGSALPILIRVGFGM
jgi:hypothetical protein